MKKSDGVIRLKDQLNNSKGEADFLKDLDSDQIKPVIDLYGPSLVVAGAGSGKTRVIVYRVANMIYEGIHPEEILMMTFTNKAAREMRDRIGVLVGDSKGLTCGTYHHVGNLILRRYASLVGLKSNYTIMDDDDVRSLLKLSRMNIDPKNKQLPKEKVIKEIISLSINKGCKIKEVIFTQFKDFYSQCDVIEQIAREYMRLKIKSNVVDYDDILLYWKIILEKNPLIREGYNDRFKYLLIDEYQDTNKLQSDIVDLMVGKERNIMVVGDPNQSVYSWRGADIGNILSFENTYEGCKVYNVSYNYRSTENILKLSNNSINNNTKRSELDLKPIHLGGSKPVVFNFPDSETEARYIVQEIEELIEEGTSLKDISVLYRNHYFAKDIEMELTRLNIPYELRSGVKFFDKKHIKDVISFVRMNVNITDEISWARSLQQIEGVGAKTISTIIGNILNTPGDIKDYILNETEFSYVRRGKEPFKLFIDMLKVTINLDTVQDIIKEFLEKHYERYIKLQFDNYEDRLDDVKALIDYSFKYDSITEFLEDISLLEEVYGKEDTDSSNEDVDKIVLSTIHRSKGLEWKYVYLIGCTKGKFPSIKGDFDEDYLEEERRLFYVASTRAENELNISYVNMEYSFSEGRRVLVSPSEFLLELSKDVYDHFTYEK